MPESNDQFPFVSVVMPVRNEADFIERSLMSVLRNDYPADRLEVLVADGISDDQTRQIVNRIAKDYPCVELIENPSKIVSTGLNIALKQIKGDIFIRVDGHCEIPSDFISKSVRTLLLRPEAWVAGGYWKTVSTGLVGQTISAATQSFVGVGNARHRLGNYDGWVDTLPYGAHHSWVLKKIGYFDEQLVRNQDDEFNLRIRLAGGKIWMSSAIWSTYYARSTLKRLWRQYFQYGFWRVRTIQKHGQPATLRQVAPVFFVSSLLVLGMLSFLHPVFLCLFAGELLLYVIGITAGAIDVGRKTSLYHLMLSPLVFTILHFGYGFGCFWGFFRFIILRGRGLPKPEEHKLSR